MSQQSKQINYNKTVKVYSDSLNQGKYNELLKIAKLCGDLTTDIWNRFGSINSIHENGSSLYTKRYTIGISKNTKIESHLDPKYNELHSNIVTATVKTAKDNIEANLAAAK